MPGSIGSVSVSVVPSAEGFTDELREQLLPEADELGQQLGEEIRAGIEEALAETEFTVQANTAAAKADIDDLRAQADDLDAEFTVEADTAEANADVDKLEAKLDDLDAEQHAADITANTGEATAAVEQLGSSLEQAAAGSEQLQDRMDSVSGASERLSDWLEELNAAVEGSEDTDYDYQTALEATGGAVRKLGFALQDLGDELVATGGEAGRRGRAGDVLRSCGSDGGVDCGGAAEPRRDAQPGR